MHISTAEQKERLHARAHKYVNGRYRVVNSSETSMTLAPAHRGINIAIDVVLVFFTAGLWFLAIIIEWLVGMYSTISLSVDPHGNVTVSGRPPLMRYFESKS